MESNRFFIFINRLNAIAFALLLITSLASIAFINIMSNDWRERRTVALNENSEHGKKTELILGGMTRIKGQPGFYVELREEHESASFSSSGYGHTPTRNILFFSGEKANPTWLFPTNEFLINEVSVLKQDRYSDDETAVIIAYEIVHKDTNANQKLDERDKTSLAITKTDGSGLKSILTDVDALIDYSVSEDHKFIDTIYQKNRKVYMERFLIDSGASTSKTEISQIN